MASLIAYGTPVLAGTHKSKTRSSKTKVTTQPTTNGSSARVTTTSKISSTPVKPEPSPQQKAVWQSYRHQTGSNL
jgi:hypothetical protein